MKKLGILEPDHFSEKAIEALQKVYEVEKYTGGDIKSFIEDKSVLFVRLKYEISDELLERASHLEYICSPTTGLNHITTSRNVSVICLKNEWEFLSTIRATPEHTFGLALALLRNYRNCFLSVTNSEWNRDLYRGEEVYLNKVGIIGSGRVGKIIASYYQAFGATISYYDIKKITGISQDFRKEDTIEELINNNNIIHMCASYSDEYRYFFDKKYFDLLEGKYFINTARGELINETDLYSFIRDNKYKGVALDVLSGEAEEGFDIDKLLQLAEGKNVIITPHISGATYSSMMRTEEFIAEKLLKIMEHC